MLYMGFDFGYRNIGVAIGQRLTGSATPLPTLHAQKGVPNWNDIQKLIKQWNPDALIVGLPTCIDGKSLYITKPAKKFATQLNEKFHLPVHLIDERLSTKEARSRLFAEGGYRRIQECEVDSAAACVILEQWLHTS
jgi:putative Holliday junction resolvase